MEEWCCGGGEPEFVLGANLGHELESRGGTAAQVTVPRAYRCGGGGGGVFGLTGW